MDERPVLEQVNLVVHDMNAMVRFYEHLGVRFSSTPPEWASHHRSGDAAGVSDFDLDSSSFAAVWNRGWEPEQTGVVLTFRVPSRVAVDELHSELVRAGYQSQQPPYDAFWGARFAVVVDPDGNSVGLMSPSEDSFRQASPAPPA